MSTKCDHFQNQTIYIRKMMLSAYSNLKLSCNKFYCIFITLG